MILACVHGLIVSVFIVPTLITAINESGDMEDLQISGTSLYLALVITVLIQIFVDTHCISLLYIAS